MNAVNLPNALSAVFRAFEAKFRKRTWKYEFFLDTVFGTIYVHFCYSGTNDSIGVLSYPASLSLSNTHTSSFYIFSTFASVRFSAQVLESYIQLCNVWGLGNACSMVRYYDVIFPFTVREGTE